MDSNRIDDGEILYRVIKKSYPDSFINGKPSAALFIDKKGVSVDRDGGREERTIIESFIDRFDKHNDYAKAVKIEARKCRDIGTHPVPAPSRNNKYHAEIHESEDTIEIDLLKAMQLAKACTIVE